jgi:hypothetical protein
LIRYVELPRAFRDVSSAGSIMTLLAACVLQRYKDLRDIIAILAWTN